MAKTTQQTRPNGNQAGSQGGGSNRKPRNELQLKNAIVDSATGIPLVEHVNLGQGNYSETAYWQQVRSYRRGLFLHTAFSEILSKRAIYETKVKLGKEGYNAHYDDVTEDVDMFDPADVEALEPGESRRDKILERGEEIWRRLGDPELPLTNKQAAAIEKKAGVETDWLPISWQMVIGRHEASRSRDAELIRDVFTNINQLRTDDSNGSDISKLLNGGNKA